MSGPSRASFIKRALLSVGAVAFLACSDSPTGLQRRDPSGNLLEYGYSSGGLFADSTAWYRRAWVCSVGSNGVFSVSVDSGPPTLHNVTDDLCVQLHYNSAGASQLITITWVDSLGATLDSIVTDSTHGGTKLRLATMTTETERTITTTTSKGGILAFHFTAAAFSMLPPDGVPDSLFDDSRILESADSVGVPIYAGLVTVMFDPNAASTARGLAVAAVGGTIVGGRRTPGYEGYDSYLLRVSDDSAGAGVAVAVALLNEDSAVLSASHVPARPATVTYARPTDGAGMSAADYKFEPDSSYTGSTTWGLNTIGAPLAWGCATGNGVKVAVVDMGLASNAELAGRNTMSPNVRGPLSGPRNAHGQRVASTLAATADNDTGTAGIAYEAELQLIDVAKYHANGSPDYDANGELQSSPYDQKFAIWEAMVAGARVVNISLGKDVNTTPTANTLNAWAVESNDIAMTLEPLKTNPQLKLPLLVISAGNNGLTAHGQWGAYAGLRHDTLTQSITLLVSAAGKTKGTRWIGSPQSATGSGTIDLFAPGQELPVYDSLGGYMPDSGTGSSYATPLVAGTAALALEVDPTLTAAELRDLLIASGSSSRGVGGVPLLDAYETVRRAAQRHGASLCGNRVWSDTSNRVFAQRTSGPEVLFTAGATLGDANGINVLRGGRRINLHQIESTYELQSGGSWTQAGSFSGADTGNWSAGYKGAALSQDMDDRFASWAATFFDDSEVWFRIWRVGLGTGFIDDSMVTPTLSLPLSSSQSFSCTRDVLSDTVRICQGGIIEGTREFVGVTADPGFPTTEPGQGSAPYAVDGQGRFAISAVNVGRLEVEVDTTWIPCIGGDGASFPVIRCREVTKNQTSSVRSKLVRINFSTHAIDTLTVSNLSAGDVIMSVSLSTDGKELAMQVGRVTFERGTFVVTACSNERYLWVALPTGSATSTTQVYNQAAPGGAICSGMLWNSAGTMDRYIP